jgi:hypothetical protein
MKRIFIIAIIVLAFVLPVNASDSYYKLTKANYPITVNGKDFSTDKPILNYNGTTYLPLRDISKATNTIIDWDNTNQKIKIKSENKSQSESISVKYYYLIDYYTSLYNKVNNQFTTTNNQFNMYLGLLTSPGGDIPVTLSQLQSLIREAKSDIILNYLTNENSSYKYLIDVFKDQQKAVLDEIKNNIENAAKYYLDATIDRAINNNKNDFTSLDTDFWKLKGEGNKCYLNVLNIISHQLDLIKVKVRTNTAND